ncbi:hypothetical protein ATCC90586_011356 [Pythium insidiosum]|nr:hypothetical protein ATCC90586_011356 [Pythium insidiosum]
MTLRLPIQYADDAYTLRMSISIKFLWKRLQEILTVENNDELATVTFQCDKGVVELAPGHAWTHPYINGATAIATMQSIEITKVVVGGKALFAHQCRLEVASEVSKSAAFDAKADEFAENLEKVVEAIS